MDALINCDSATNNINVPVGVSKTNPAQMPPSGRLHVQLARIAALTDLLGQIESAPDQNSACQTLVDRLQEFLQVEQVFLGLSRDSSPGCRLQAISNMRVFNPRDELSLSAQAVLQEVIARDEPACWPVADATSRGGLLAHRQFSTARQDIAIASGVLRDSRGKLRGAWMVTGATETVLNSKVTGFLRAAETPVASALALIERAEAGRIHKAWQALLRLVREQRGQMLIAAAVVAALILCVPVHYHPACECSVEPVTRRYVAAPFNGPLENAFVQPGDEVVAGQLLARMDGREVKWELAGIRAELHRAGKERAGHMATHDSGQAEVARYEVDRLRLRTELLEHRDQNLEIRSPISGVVVGGDLDDAVGIPLEVGQTLFEIAPLDEMTVMVEIAEDDFKYVRTGLPAIVQLDAYPLRRFPATIARIHPRAEIIDDKNVFLAEVRLTNTDGSLRPGMRGTAEIEADRQLLGWTLFRRPFTALVSWLGW